MKKTVITASILAVLGMSGSAMAASMSPELSVKGKMAVPSCTLSMVGGGIFDLGNISNSLIQPQKATELKSMSQPINVNCDAVTYLSFTVEDNREGTASVTNPQYFGLGNVNSTGKLGYYQIHMYAPVVDGVGVKAYATTKGSTAFTAQDAVYLNKDYVMGWAKSSSVQISGKKFSTYLEVKPMLASSKDMNGPIADNVKLDGSSTLNFTYGL
ncbi:DUF1120 domain-containing protein [Serratia marcescens]